MRQDFRKPASPPTVSDSGRDPCRAGRWIRPALAHLEEFAPSSEASPPSRPLSTTSSSDSVDEWSNTLLLETRQRVSHLTALERQLEERIRRRWREAEEEGRKQAAALAAELAEGREQAAADRQLLADRAAEEGRASGYSEGFSQGREEGMRQGREEGRQAGQADIADERRKDIEHVCEALAQAVEQLGDDRAVILQEYRSHLVSLAIEVAKKILKREIARFPDSVLRNVEKAVELIFRRGTLDIQVHPEDAPHVEDVLQSEPRWTEGFEHISVSSSDAVSRGGCRVVSSAGAVDMTIETQQALIAEALEESLHQLKLDSPPTAPRVAPDALEGKR